MGMRCQKVVRGFLFACFLRTKRPVIADFAVLLDFLAAIDGSLPTARRPHQRDCSPSLSQSNSQPPGGDVSRMTPFGLVPDGTPPSVMRGPQPHRTPIHPTALVTPARAPRGRCRRSRPRAVWRRFAVLPALARGDHPPRGSAVGCRAERVSRAHALGLAAR